MKGAVKRYNIKQLTTEADGTCIEIVHPIELNLKPGIQTGTPFVYSRLGDIHEGKLAADIMFKVTEKDTEFVRDFANLLWKMNVPLDKFQVGKQIEVRTSIYCEDLKITQEMIDNNLFRFKGFGLPYPNNPIKRGDLIINFNCINKENEGNCFVTQIWFTLIDNSLVSYRSTIHCPR